MQHRTRTPRSGQGTTPRTTPGEDVQRARIQRELGRLPREARALLTRTHMAGAALAAVAIAVTLDPGSQAWIASRLIAAYPWALGYLLRLGASLQDAQEIAQASILEGLAKARTFDLSRVAADDPVRAWFGGFLQNIWLDRRRWRRTRREIPLDTVTGGLSVPSHAERVEARDLLLALQAATTPERWRAWRAFEVDHDSPKAIAEREQVPASTIQWRILCARKDFDRVLRKVGCTRRTGRRTGGA